MRDRLAIRRREIVPRLAGAIFGNADAASNGLLTASWRLGDGETLRLTANLSAGEIVREPTDPTGTSIWGGESSELFPPWSVFWRIGAR